MLVNTNAVLQISFFFPLNYSLFLFLCTTTASQQGQFTNSLLLVFFACIFLFGWLGMHITFCKFISQPGSKWPSGILVDTLYLLCGALWCRCLQVYCIGHTNSQIQKCAAFHKGKNTGYTMVSLQHFFLPVQSMVWEAAIQTWKMGSAEVILIAKYINLCWCYVNITLGDLFELHQI